MLVAALVNQVLEGILGHFRRCARHKCVHPLKRQPPGRAGA